MKMKARHVGKKARVEIIPLIDVVFFLLATFVLICMSMTRLQGVNQQLPKAVDERTNQEPPPQVVVHLSANDTIYWDGLKLDNLDQFGARASQYYRDNPSPRLQIAADTGAAYGLAIAVIDRAKAIGITQIGLDTKVKDGPPVQ